MELKILHTADWHLDAPFTSFPPGQRDILLRAQRAVPGQVAKVCREEGCDLVLLAGDIFDGGYTRETLNILREALADCGVPVFVSPGNHDYCVPGSPWVEEMWPDNVHIFTGGLSWADVPELGCRVYGAGYSAMDCPGLLEGFRAEGNLPYRVAVLHGDATMNSSPYCPVTAAQVRDSGLDYLALGHIHRAGGFRAGATLCAWPGCPMGRGWDETGEKGLCIVTLGETAEIRTVPLDTLRFRELEAEIHADGTDTLDSLLPPVGGDDFYRVTLTGTGSADLPRLYERYAHLPNLEFRDRTEAPLDVWADVGEDSLRGMYFRLLRDAEERADDRAARQIRLAAEISKKLLEGREVILP